MSGSKPQKAKTKTKRSQMGMGRTPIPADLLKSIPNRTAVVTGLLSVLLDDKCPVAVREWAFLQGHRLGQQEKAGEPFSTNNAYEQFLKVIRSTD